MKKFIQSLQFVFLFPILLSAQDCILDGFVFERQGQVDSFSINYPGCTEIEGTLSIGYGVENLQGLSGLTHIGGDLRFYNNVNLESFRGLESLLEIGGELAIVNVHGISNLEGFGNLKRIGESLRIWETELNTLHGLYELEYIGGSLRFLYGEQDFLYKNTYITDQVLPKLDTIKGGVTVQEMPNARGIGALTGIAYLGGIAIVSCPRFERIDLYTREFNGYLSLTNNEGLNNIGAIKDFPKASITSLRIRANPKLTTCVYEPICEFLTNEANSAEISDNGINCSSSVDVIGACTGEFPECPPGNVTFYYQTDILEFQSKYPNCTKINGNLILSDQCDSYPYNTSNCINSINRLGKIERVNGSLVFDLRSNPMSFFYSNPDLPNLEYVGGSFKISAPLDTLRMLDKVKHVGSLEIKYAQNLLPLDSLQVDSLGSLILEHVGWDAIPQFGSLKTITGDLKLISTDFENLETFKALTNVQRSVEITNNPDLQNLEGLSNIHQIKSNLLIRDNEKLQNLNGLDSINTLGGTLSIINNNALIDLAAVSSLSSVNSLIISSNNMIERIDGFKNLAEIGGGLQIRDNAALRSLEGFSSLQESGEVRIEDNPKLENIIGLNTLKRVNGDFRIEDNNLLMSLQGLSNLNYIEEDLRIAGDSLLTNLDPLQSLSSVHQLLIYRNDNLESISGLSSINSLVGGLYIGDNPVLKSLNGLQNISGESAIRIDSNAKLESLRELQGINKSNDDIDIIGNDLLENLEGLQNIVEIEGNLSIWGNASLLSTAELSEVVEVGELIWIISNDSLETLEGLNKLETSGSGIRVSGNDALVTIDAFKALQHIKGGLDIYSNDSLKSLAGFNNLRVIDADLDISRNATLESLDGLNSNLNMNGLELDGNYKLTDITALENANGAEWDKLVLINNRELECCNIQSICDFTAVNNGFAGRGNKGWCESPVEVYQSCMLREDLDLDGYEAKVDCDDSNPNVNPGVPEIPDNGIDEDCDGEDLKVEGVNFKNDWYQISPNPTGGYVYINITEARRYSYRIANSLGETLIEKGGLSGSTDFDISSFQDGVYYIFVTNTVGTSVVRLIKQ